MLEKFYQNLLEYYQLKYQVLEKIALQPLKFASIQELLDAVSQHGKAYAAGDKTITTDLCHKQLLNSILNRLNNKSIQPELKASLFLAENFNANIISNYQLSRPIKQLFYVFTLAWFRFAIENPQLAVKDDCKIQVILRLLLKISRRIDHYSGAPARKYCHSLFRLLLAYASSAKQIPSFENLLQRIDIVEKELINNRKMNLQETINNLRNIQKSRLSREVTSSQVRETIGDGIYPVILLDFVETYINLYLEDYYIKNGPKGVEWRQTLKDLSYLIWAFRANVDKDYRLYFPSKIPPAMHRLLLKVEPFVDDLKRLYLEFIGLEDILRARYLGEFINLDSVFNAPYFSADSLFDNQINNWHKTNQHKSDWFHILYHNKEVIGQLLSKEILQNQIAFINYSGKPIIVHDTNNPSFSAEDIQVIPLNDINDWGYLATALEYEITSVQSNFYESYKDVIQSIDNDKIADMKKQQELKAELEKQNFELRMEIENRRHLKLLKKQKAVAREHERQAIADKKREENKEKINKIKIGAVIYAEYKTSHKIKLELNIITSTTNRYIFNDRNCQHRLALKREELLEMLTADKITIESYGRGEQYHQTLANVISSRRKNS